MSFTVAGGSSNLQHSRWRQCATVCFEDEATAEEDATAAAEEERRTVRINAACRLNCNIWVVSA